MKQYKKHSTNNSKQNKYKYNVHITKTPTHPLTHTLQNKLKQVTTNTVKDIPKRNSHNIIKYPQYKITLTYMALLSSITSP